MESNEKELKEQILKDLFEFSKGVPVEWHNVVESNDYIAFYGWIIEEGKDRDFIIFIYINDNPDFEDEDENYPEDEEDTGCYTIFFTSSEKYSKLLSKNHSGNSTDHIPCKSFKEWFGDALS